MQRGTLVAWGVCGWVRDDGALLFLNGMHRAARCVSTPTGKLKFSMAGGSSFHRVLRSWTPQRPGDRASDRPTATAAHSRDRHDDAPVSCAEPAPAVLDVHHPRSNWLRRQLAEGERHFKLLARVADVTHTPAEAQALHHVRQAP